MDDKSVPHNLDSERNVLGSILLGRSDALVQVCDWLKPSHFYAERYGKCYKAMLDLFLRNEPIDIVTVGAELEKVSEPGIMGKLMELLDATPTPIHIAHHGREVMRLSNCRKLIELSAKIAATFYAAPKNIDAEVGRVATQLLNVVENSKRNSPDPRDIILELMGRDHRHVAYTDMYELNRLSGGIEPTHLWVVGGFSSTGKTAFALQLLLEMLKQKKRCAYFSLEMSRHQLMLRLLGNYSGVPIWKVDKGSTTDDEHDAIAEAQDFFGQLSGAFWIYDDCYDLTEIEYLCRKLKIQSGLDLVFIDFIQNLRGGSDEYERLSDAAKSIQALAKQLDCTIFVLSQISNEQARDNMGASQAYSFKGSGAIRDAADKAWMLTRDRDADMGQEVGALVARLMKNRQGPIGEVKLRFEFATGRIKQSDNTKH